ncbi:hypothetical protein OHA70_19705 [Kribbella sp. NBC_00382]|uniref:hypothetical protein n=1 Tax=Kribbella sp. NBC_00382 TaxID=2975967 RepID=UPI002E221D16
MSLTRTFRTSLALATIGGSALVAMTAAPASAAIVESNCVYGYNASQRWQTATCYDDNSSYWYLRADCERPNGNIIHQNGSAAYGPGEGTSHVQCPLNTWIYDTNIVLVNY